MSRPRKHRQPHPRRRAFTPAQIAERAASVPSISYPDALPVSARRDDIMSAIRDHQVVIVSGATGSGKTTQLPKMCLELGRGITGLIGHTQPRRIAARSVAERIASELGGRVGDLVGYQVRFTDDVSSRSLIKLMTDGIILAEIASDPLLTRYDTIIVDEAHERSLNIDFLLGYLAQLLPKRPDLKLIITSATIDSARFADHFASVVGSQVPVIDVSGRTYPVEIRYRPLADEEGNDVDVATGVCDAVDELCEEGEGDILVFLPGERDIRDTDQALHDHLGARYLSAGEGEGKGRRADAIEVVPLYARLSPAEQHRVFAPHATRRIVLATNVAETSLTVPGIRYVVDPGLARLSRYSNRTKVQRLPIEKISQASANQRSGRCGRLAAGVAIRLYSEEDFEARPAFTEPEILRTSLASVILSMASLGLTPIEGFPFVDAPDPRQIRDGINLLVELGALKDPRSLALTKIGRTIAKLPVDPRLARVLVEADRRGCASEVLVIVAALSMQDVRLRPAESQGAADAAHARFIHERSDFLSYLTLWRYLRTQQRDLSSSALRRLCQREYLHYLRSREWQDMVGQLRRMAADVGIKVAPIRRPSVSDIESHRDPAHPGSAAVAAACLEYSRAADVDAIHRSLLVGFLSNLGRYDASAKDYEGARGAHFTIWPGSGLAKRHYDWVMCAELVETSRLFARTLAAIDPAWVEEAAGPLLKRSYSGIFWSSKNGAAMIRERASLYGLTILADRPVLLGRLGDRRLPKEAPVGGSAAEQLKSALAGEPQAAPTAREIARDMFIRHALVEGKWRGRYGFVSRNEKALADAREIERRTRRGGIVAGPDALAAFFADKIGPEVVSEGHFNRWWKRAGRQDPRLLDYPPQLLLPRPDAGGEAPATYSSGEAPDGSVAAALGDGVSPADLARSASQREAWGFPDRWRGPGASFALSYEFDPSSERDGVSMRVPVAALAGLDEEALNWLVPGMWPELMTSLVKNLPKRVRRQLVPAPEVGEEACAWIRRAFDDPTRVAKKRGPSAAEKKTEALAQSMARLASWAGIEAPGDVESSAPTEDAPSISVAWDRRYTAPETPVRTMVTLALDALRGVEIDDDAWEQTWKARPAHLRMTIVAVDSSGREVAQGTDPHALARACRTRAQAAVREAISAASRTRSRRGHQTFSEATGLESAPATPIPDSVRVATQAGSEATVYPALVHPGPPDPSRSEADTWRGWSSPWSVDLLARDRAVLAARDHAEGIVALTAGALALPYGRVSSRWRGLEAATLAASPYPSTEALIDDLTGAAADRLTHEWSASSQTDLAGIRDAKAAEQIAADLRDRFEDEVYRQAHAAAGVLAEYRRFLALVEETASLSLLDVVTAERAHVGDLVRPGFVSAWTGRLDDVARYVKAARIRLERAREDAGRDKGLSWQVREAGDLVEDALARARRTPWSRRGARAAWDLVAGFEELRVSLFAQQLGTRGKISVKRLHALAARL
ncbi:MAG: ATP-dependent RNA helicase HrpA [Actinomycetaceae bacterium]|nr:ATP-dependent RNA helicase HrpA [Actinomycetaceae bacterium]